ncbi:MAG: hypothetical protein JSR59_12015 [Proteobacteria bacterium]|nr:hypothetical protein [Pseudomonadota bacterium]
MKVYSPLLVAACSVLALMPATVFLIAGTIFFIGAVVSIGEGRIFLPEGGIDFEALYITLSYVTGVVAIWRFWALAIATVRERQIPFAWPLGLAITCACVSAVGASLVGGVRVFVFVVLPVCMLVSWLLHLQYRR